MNNTKTIYKYELLDLAAPDLDQYSSKWITLPFGAEPLSIVEQYNKVVLYALVTAGAGGPSPSHRFYFFGTGHPVRMSRKALGKFMGTIKLHGGALMFHCYLKGDVSDMDPNMWVHDDA